MAERTLRSEPGSTVTIVVTALLVLCAAATVVQLGTLDADTQRLAVMAVSVALPTLVILLARPFLGLLAYLILLPLLPVGSEDAIFNAGEVLTAGVVALGIATAAPRVRRLSAAREDLGPILWPIAALGVVSVVSLLANEVTAPGEILSAVFKLVAFGVIAVLVYLHADSPRKARLLLLAVVLGGVAEAAYSLGAFALGLDYYGEYGYDRASGTFSTWNHLGGFMALTSMPTLAYAYYVEPGRTRWLLLAAFVAQIATLLLSLTLGSVLGLLVGGLIAVTFMFRIPLKRVAGSMLAFGGVFLVVYLLNPVLQEKVGRIGERVLDRLITYAVGISMLEDRFWFGFGSQAEVIEALFLPLRGHTFTAFGESSVVPHASVLSIGVEKGIFGALFFVLLVIGAVRVLLKQRARFAGSREALLFQGAVVGLLAFLVQDMTNNLLLHARLGIIFFAVLAACAALGRHVDATRDTVAAP